MKNRHRTLQIIITTAVFTSSVVFAEKPSWISREIPARILPIPNTVSLQERVLIASPFSPLWKECPKSVEAWKTTISRIEVVSATGLLALRKLLSVKMESTEIGGVKAFIFTPKVIAPENKNRLLVNLHGGGYVFGRGESGTLEAILMAAYGKCKVIAVDYRMPPDFPYPAAMDDVMTVWKELIKTHNPKNMAVFGSSTGGGLTLAMILRAKQEGLPLPAAIAPGTPWSDLTKTGDTYFSNDKVDNVLVSYDGWLSEAAKLYANGHDLKDPMLSPVYGDYHGFPPAILTSGTRDLFLSNTVRVHRKMRAAGVVAELHVFEGQSHAQYEIDPFAPETKEHFAELVSFFNRYLANQLNVANGKESRRSGIF